LNNQKQIVVTLMSLEIFRSSLLCPDLPKQASLANGFMTSAEVVSDLNFMIKSETNSSAHVSPITEDDSPAVLHRAVVFLVKQGELGPPAVSLDELHAGLIAKHTGLSKTKLQSIITDNPKIFLSDAEGKIGLRELDHELVRTYFEMADDVGQTMTSEFEPNSYSLTSP
jgi:hypothetical protein